MRLAIIGSSTDSVHTIECARDLGIEVLAIDGNADADGLKYADIPVVVDIKNTSEVTDVIKKHGVDWIQTVPIGRYLTITGIVNDALELPGITYHMAELCTDKYAFHRALNSAGLRDCMCFNIEHGTALDPEKLVTEYVASTSNPAIFKPRFGSGSRGVMTAGSEKEIRNKLSLIEKADEDYIFEECIDGIEYGVDAAVIDGELQIILIRRKINTPLPNRQAVGSISVDSGDAIYSKTYEYLVKIIETLKIDECLLNADIIDTGKNIFAIEVATRPSGHNMHNLFVPLCTGVDMVKEYMLRRMSKPYHFKPEYFRTMMIHFFDYEGLVKKVPRKNEVDKVVLSAGADLVKWSCNIKEGDFLEQITNGHSIMGRGFFIVNSDDPDVEKYAKIADMVKDSFVILKEGRRT